MELIESKLIQDLHAHFKDKNLDALIKEKVHNNISKINTEITSKNHFRSNYRDIDENNRCEARVWNDHFGGRCKNSIKKDKLCLRHYNLQDAEKTLEFGRICDRKPTHNRHGKKLTWYENTLTIDDHIHMLQMEYRNRITTYILHTLKNEKS